MDQSSYSLQEMVKNPISQIPPRYLVGDEDTAMKVSPVTIPVVDLKALEGADSKRDELERLKCTCKEWGIFEVVNHGVESVFLEKVKKDIEEFYSLPLEERLRFKIREGDVEGYGQTVIVEEGQKVDWADRMFIITNPIHRRKPHLLPLFPSPLRETLESYILELQKVSMAIFGGIAESLGIEYKEVEAMFENGVQAVRMTYYPPCPQPDKVMGLTPHSDVSGITILLQVNGVQGFQIKKDGVWLPLNIRPNALVVNLGDATEIFSNGIYKSIEHRAIVNSDKERVSIAMFFSPKYDSEVGPSPSLLSEQQPPLFRRLTMEQYLKDFFSKKLHAKSFLHYLRLPQN